MRRHSIAILLLIFTTLASGARAQHVTWKQLGGSLGFGIQCGYFWNRGEGVVATGAGQFYYLRNGVWHTGPKLIYGSSVNSIRCFDGRTLYAPVLYNHRSQQLWQSNDSGVTWSQIPIQYWDANFTGGNNGSDVYWNYRLNAPVLRGTTTIRLDSADLASTSDYFGEGPAETSFDGGASWGMGVWNKNVSSYNYYTGGGVCADRTNKLYYSTAEAGQPGMFRSSDSGRTWSVLTSLPQNLFMMDEVNGIYDKTFIQTSLGCYETTDSGNTWNFIGGPVRRNSDDARLCVFGCTGRSLIAFGDDGTVWLANGADAPDPAELRSNFAATPQECDTGIITITLSQDFALWPLFLSIDDDSGGHFRLLTSDTVVPSSSEQQIRIAFSAADLREHNAQLSIMPIGFAGCPMARVLTGQAHIVRPKVVAPRPVLACAQVFGTIKLTNPNCEPLRLTLDSSNSPDLVMLPFDSIVVDTVGLPFRCPPQARQGYYSYSVHIHGNFEPSNVPFDTVVWATVQYGYVPSRLDASSYILDLGIVNACTTFDTAILFENLGCDTLFVPLDQALQSGWSVTPNTDTLRMLPGDVDSVRIQFTSVRPGDYHEKLSYKYLGRSSGTIDFDLTATVSPAMPALQLSSTIIDLGSRSICANDSILEIAMTNESCDTIKLSDTRLDSGALFHLLNNADTTLLPGDRANLFIAFIAQLDTASEQHLTLHISRTDGSLGFDTTLTFAASVTGTRKQLAASTAAIDMGQTYICEERDTSVIIQNTGCDSVCVSDLSLLGTGFRIMSDTSGFCLPPSTSDTVWLATEINTSNSAPQNNDTLLVTSNAKPPIPPIPLSREIAYPVPWALTLTPPMQAAAGTPVTYAISQSGELPNDVTALDMTVSYADDLLHFVRADESSVVPGTATRDANGTLHQEFRISPVGNNFVLATLSFLPYVALDSQTAITLDSVNFVSALDRPNDCIASVETARSSFTLIPECGTSELVRLMGSGTIQIVRVDPNPANGMVAVSIASGRKNVVRAELSVVDALGRIVLRRALNISPGSGQFPLDLTSIAKGFYTILLRSEGVGSGMAFLKE